MKNEKNRREESIFVQVARSSNFMRVITVILAILFAVIFAAKTFALGV